MLACLSLGAAAAAEKPAGLEDLKTVDAVAAEIASYFPKIQGEVQAVDGDRVTINMGTKNGLVAGMTLMLWRDGKEILHPVTGALIGRTEDEIGTFEVSSLAETSCTGYMKEKKKQPNVGDKARITPKKINLAVLPVEAAHSKIMQSLAERLSDSGRFMVLPADKVAAYLQGRKERDTALINDMAKVFSLDVVVACSTYPAEGGRVLLTAKLFYAGEARPFRTVVAILDLQDKRELIGEIKPYFAPSLKDDKTGITDLPFAARFVVAADFERRGTLQYAFSDGQRIHIYKRDATGWVEEWAEPAPADVEGRQHVNIDAADINGNGTPELFVTLLQKDKVLSYVLEYREGIYQRIAEVPAFLRVLSYPGKGALLLGQPYDIKNFFGGKPQVYAWSGGKYAPDREFPLPKGFTLYGFAIIEAGEADPLIVAFDDKDRIIVYLRGSPIWKSEDIYPSFAVSANKAVATASAVISQSVADADSSQKVKIVGRILAMDTNGDGREEIIVPKNIASSYLPIFTNAEIVDLGWTGSRLEKRWSIPEIGGAVLDYQLLKSEGGGARILSLVQDPGGLFAADHYRVQSFTAK